MVFYKLSKTFGWTPRQIAELTEFEVNYYLTIARKAELNEAVDTYLAYEKTGRKKLLKKSVHDPVRRRHIFRQLERSAEANVKISNEVREKEMQTVGRIMEKIKKEKGGK